MDTLGKLQLQRHNTDRLFCEKSYGGLRESLTNQNALHELMWESFVPVRNLTQKPWKWFFPVKDEDMVKSVEELQFVFLFERPGDWPTNDEFS